VLFGCLAVLFGAVAFVGCYSGIGPYDLPPKSRALEETLAVSRSLGLPMTQAELVGEVPPDEENAAIGVIAILDRLDFSNTSALLGRTGTDKVARDARDAWLKTNAKHLDEAKRVLAKSPHWQVDRDYDLGPTLLFPELAKIKHLAKGYFTRAITAADNGDLETALSDFRAIRDISRRLSSEPTLIALLSSVAIDTIALRSVVYYTDAFKDDAGALAKIEDVVAATRHRKDAFSGIRGEFHLQLHVSRNWTAYDGFKGVTESMTDEHRKRPDPSKIERDGLPSGLMARASMASLAETWNRVLTLYLKDGKVKRGWGEEMARLCSAMESEIKASEIYAMIVMPVYKMTDDALINNDVMQDVAVAFVRAMRHRATTGAWPRGLSTIGAEFEDPFSPGQSIQMSAKGGELRVWSVGRDRTDNGGVPSASGDRSGDTVFKWPPKLPKGS
jgi:hypothetical protein